MTDVRTVHFEYTLKFELGTKSDEREFAVLKRKRKNRRNTEQGWWIDRCFFSYILKGENKFESLGDSDVIGVEVEKTGEQKSGDDVDSNMSSLSSGLSDYVWTSVIVDDSMNSPEMLN